MVKQSNARKIRTDKFGYEQIKCLNSVPT